MKLARVDAAFETCDDHLNETGAFGSEIEAILTSYVSGVIYSAAESRVREIAASRAAGNGSDAPAASFASRAASKLVRSIKISELAGIAGMFDAACKDRFQDALTDEDRAAWDTVLNNRHLLAHEQGKAAAGIVSNLTFLELKMLYPRVLRVLEAFEGCLTPETT